jgi:hypothetical protein
MGPREIDHQRGKADHGHAEQYFSYPCSQTETAARTSVSFRQDGASASFTFCDAHIQNLRRLRVNLHVPIIFPLQLRFLCKPANAHNSASTVTNTFDLNRVLIIGRRVIGECVELNAHSSAAPIRDSRKRSISF